MHLSSHNTCWDIHKFVSAFVCNFISNFQVLSTSSRCSVPVGTPPSMPGIVPRTAPPVMFPAPTVSHPVLDISAASHTHDTFAGHYVRPVHSSLVYTGVCPPMGSNYYQDPRSILYAENGAQPFLGPPREPLGPPREQLGPHREQLGPPREPLGPPREPLGPPREPLGPPREPLGLSQPSRGPADSEALVSGQSQLAPEPYGHRSPTPAQTTTAHWRPSCPQPQTHSTVNSMAGEFRPSYPQPRPHSMVNSVAGDFGRLAVQVGGYRFLSTVSLLFTTTTSFLYIYICADCALYFSEVSSFSSLTFTSWLFAPRPHLA